MGVSAFPRRIYTNDSNIAYWNEVNWSDGTWTHTDTTAMVKSYGFNAINGNTVTFENVAAASPDQNVGGAGSGVSNCPRWFKALTYDDGTTVNANDKFVVSVVSDMKGPIDNIRYMDWYIGICNSPTNPTIATTKFHGVGTGWNFANTDADVFGTLISGVINTAATPLDPDDTVCHSTMMHIGGNSNIEQITIDPSGTQQSNSVFANQVTSLTGPVYIMLQVGFRGTGRSVLVDQSFGFRVKYKISRLVTGDI